MRVKSRKTQREESTEEGETKRESGREIEEESKH